MKPPPFAYHRAESVDDALDVLAQVGSEGKVLAGGQSLVPVLNMRLAAPAHLVDINRIDELGFIRVERDGTGPSGPGVRVGATARHAEIEHDETAYAAVPLLRQALVNVAHPTIRNRGTTLGSLVHADPSGEMTAVLALLGGSVELRSADGTREVEAGEFFVGPLECCIRPDELATSAYFPAPHGRAGTAWEEVARRHGDYALCGVGAVVVLDDDRRVTSARTSYISIEATPVVLDLTEAVHSRPADAADWAAAGSLATGQLQTDTDIHATAEYRRHLAGVLTARALRTAARRAAGRQIETDGSAKTEGSTRTGGSTGTDGPAPEIATEGRHR